MSSETAESFGAVVLRLAAYTLLIFGLTAALPLILQHGGLGFFAENGPLEWVQFSILVTAVSVFVAGSFLVPAFRQLFFLLALVCAFASVRELDALLDDVIPGVGWKVTFVVV